MVMNLFDGSSSDDNEDISKFEINEEYRKRFEHNKKREELQRYAELKKKGKIVESEDDSSSESDFDQELNAMDADDIKLCLKLRKKDPSIFQKDKEKNPLKSDDDDDEEEEEEEEVVKKPKKKKKKYLKDVIADHLTEVPDYEEKAANSKSYVEGQEEILQEFLKVADEAFKDDDDDNEEFFKVKKRRNDEEDEDGGADEYKKGLDELIGDNANEGEEFLKKFFMNKMWIDKDTGKNPIIEDFELLSEDEEELDKQDQFEAKTNFRFEEAAGDRVLGHARFTEGSVRKKTNARKLQRKSKEERMAQAEFERKEELKHMKNEKKKEIMEKFKKIQTIGDISEGGACALNEDDLEKDFDPEEYDRKMKQTFDDEYYDAEDADPGFCSDAEKPDFDKEDELLGLSKGWDVCGSGDGFLAAREKVLNSKAESKDVDISDDSEGTEEELSEEPEEPEEGKMKRKRKLSLREKVALDKELEEYYKLDYEDTIGDLKTRFKYASVPSQRYGLSAAEILMTDDKELNQYVSLKKIAPYREKEWKVPERKRFNLKIKNKLDTKGLNLKVRKSDKKNDLKHKDHGTTTVTGDAEHGKTQVEESNGEVRTESRKSRRRRRQAELKISEARRQAYQMIPAKSKSKKKH